MQHLETSQQIAARSARRLFLRLLRARIASGGGICANWKERVRIPSTGGQDATFHFDGHRLLSLFRASTLSEHSFHFVKIPAG